MFFIIIFNRLFEIILLIFWQRRRNI